MRCPRAATARSHPPPRHEPARHEPAALARRGRTTPVTRTRHLALGALLLAAPAVWAHDGHGHQHGATATATGTLEVALVSSEVVVGPNRFAFGLFDPDGLHVQDAIVHLHFFDLRAADAPRIEAEADAVAVTTPDGFTTLYTLERTFDRAGPWGVEVQAVLADGRLAVRRIAFEVLAEGRALGAGQPVPRLRTPTAADVDGELGRITSAIDPAPALYRTSLDESVANGRPTVVLFATPSFCRTRFCGPTYEVVRGLLGRYGDAIDFIHVEIFTGLPNPAAEGWPLAPAVRGFGLATEPWLYLIDATGTVSYRIEGFFTEHEVEPHLRALLASP